MAASETEDLTLATAVTHLLEECRMILPGLQALLGFQLIAVFSQPFLDRLGTREPLQAAVVWRRVDAAARAPHNQRSFALRTHAGEGACVPWLLRCVLVKSLTAFAAEPPGIDVFLQ